jgi:hypothetical protein
MFHTVHFSADGNQVVTVWDNAVRLWDAETGSALSEPMEHPLQVIDEEKGLHADVLSAQFSPDGKRLVTASDDGSARIWDLLPANRIVPEWLLRLATAVAGESLNERGFFEPISEEPLEVLQQIREQLTRESEDDDWIRWGRWFLADRSTRTISPFSKITVPEYIENRIKESTPESLDEAERLAIGNAELLRRIAQARAMLKQ